MTPLLEITNLHLEFKTFDGVAKVLAGVDITMQRGDVLGLVGETGCGKSVTALSVARLIPKRSATITQGSILFKGEDLLRILPVFRDMGARVIAITGSPRSTLAGEADVVLDASVEREACPMDLVPTASTTAALAMGDALAVAVLAEKDVDPDLFARYHPGGALGRRLLLRVSDVMHRGEEVPVVRGDATMREAICEIANKRLGMVAVVDDDRRLQGIVTDGDLKRIIMRREDMLDAPVGEFMTTSPRTIGRDELVAAALEKMESDGPITSLLILDEDGSPDGVIHIHDCLRAVG